MPEKIKKIRGKNKFKVVNISTGQIHAKETTRGNAEAQVRFLNGLRHGMIPRKKKK